MTTFFSEEYPMSVKAYKDEAVGLKGKILKMVKAMAERKSASRFPMSNNFHILSVANSYPMC